MSLTIMLLLLHILILTIVLGTDKCKKGMEYEMLHAESIVLASTPRKLL